MTNYDISHLPPPVQAWSAPEAWRALPSELRCAYGTVSLPLDAASALPAAQRTPLPPGEARVLPHAPSAASSPSAGQAPEAVGRPQTGLRSDTTRAVLEVMETLFPRAVTAAELAPLLGLPREKITQHLIILVGRDLLVQPSRGSYRYRPRTPPPAPDAAERSSPVDPAFVQTVLDILRADLTLD